VLRVVNIQDGAGLTHQPRPCPAHCSREFPLNISLALFSNTFEKKKNSKRKLFSLNSPPHSLSSPLKPQSLPGGVLLELREAIHRAKGRADRPDSHTGSVSAGLGRPFSQ